MKAKTSFLKISKQLQRVSNFFEFHMTIILFSHIVYDIKFYAKHND